MMKRIYTLFLSGRRAGKVEVLTNEQNMRDVIATTMQCHPRDCIFVTDAEDFIYKRFLATRPVRGTAEEIINCLREAFLAAELYCPHEGIDKRPSNELPRSPI